MARTPDRRALTEPSEGWWPVSLVSARLDIPAPTLRSWERRYGLPAADRTSGGHRRFGPESVIQARLMRDEIGRGTPAALAATRVRQLRDQRGDTRAFVDGVLAASLGTRISDVTLLLDQARLDLGLETTLDDVLLPAMRQIGTLWDEGTCTVAQEHLTTAAVRDWLARVDLRTVERRRRRALLACGPRDLHTVGLEAFAALLRSRGWTCHNMGPQCPAAAVTSAADSLRPNAVVIVSHLATTRRSAVEALEAVAASGASAWYAGNAFRHPRSRHGLPGNYLGERLSDAARRLEASLRSRRG